MSVTGAQWTMEIAAASWRIEASFMMVNNNWVIYQCSSIVLSSCNEFFVDYIVGIG